MVAAQAPIVRRGETLKESSKEKDVRISNIVAAKGKWGGWRWGPKGLQFNRSQMSAVLDWILTTPSAYLRQAWRTPSGRAWGRAGWTR
jgi:hypothetical protein